MTLVNVISLWIGLFRQQELQNTIHQFIAHLVVADALERKSHDERAVVLALIGHGGTGAVGIDHGGERLGIES